MRIKAIGERVIVKRDAAETKTTGGIILQASDQDRPMQGTIICAGNSEELKEGDTVVFSKYASSTPIMIDGKSLDIMDISDIKGVIYE